jgi:hypothetical protein
MSKPSRFLLGAAATAGPLLVVLVVALLIGPRNDAAPVDPASHAADRSAKTLPATDETAHSSNPDAPRSDAEGPVPVEEAEPSRSPVAGDGSSVVVRVRNGESIAMFDAPRGELVAAQGDETEFESPSVFLVRRQTSRWLGVSTPELPNGQIAWIRSDPRRLSSDIVRHSLLVDLSLRRAHLFRMRRPVRSWRVTVGAPGTATPTGTFAITDTFAGDLNPAYGCCAFALSATQPNLPSGWRGGNRIAIHGTSGPIGAATSSGCVRSADRHLRALLRTVELGTPVFIRH